jgi:hypothetical protein
MANGITPAQAAQLYIAQGWAVVPVPARSKGPIDEGWNDPARRFSPSDFYDGENIGLRLGRVSNELADVDADSPEAVCAAPTFLPPTGMICGRQSKPRSHYFYITSEPVLTVKYEDPVLKATNSDKATIVELRANAKNGTCVQTIVPPSVHPLGERIAWADGFNPARVKAADLATVVKHLAVTALIAHHWPGEGEHGHDLVLALSGALLRSRLGLDTVRQIVGAAAKAAGYTRFKESDITDTATTLAAGQPVWGWPKLAELLPKKVVDEMGKWLSKPKRQEPAKGMEGLSGFVWEPESMATFLAEEPEPESLTDKMPLYKGCVTEVFSPRGVGKSVHVASLAAELAQKYRVILLDRDNPKWLVKARLRGWGVDIDWENLKAIARAKCPPLTRPDLWLTFPYADYDVVILDSFDSMAEGVGEQDSSKPSRAVATILDFVRQDKGPAVLVLGNCVRSGRHSRGNGVIEDRSDVVFEVRDATDFHPTSEDWVEQLPPADAGSWAARSKRRKQREKFRLAYIITKCRVGPEPSPFIVEVNVGTEPWSCTDVTDEVDREGAETRRRLAAEKAARLEAAAEALKKEIKRRVAAGEPPLRKRQDAEPILVAAKLTRQAARKLLTDRDGVDWKLEPDPQDKRSILVLPPKKNCNNGHVSTSAEAAETAGIPKRKMWPKMQLFLPERTGKRSFRRRICEGYRRVDWPFAGVGWRDCLGG